MSKKDLLEPLDRIYNSLIYIYELSNRDSVIDDNLSQDYPFQLSLAEVRAEVGVTWEEVYEDE